MLRIKRSGRGIVDADSVMMCNELAAEVISSYPT